MTNKIDDDVFVNIFDDDNDYIIFDNVFIQEIINYKILEKIRTAPLPTIRKLSVSTKNLLSYVVGINKKFYDILIVTRHIIEPSDPIILANLSELRRITLIHIEKYDFIKNLELGDSILCETKKYSNYTTSIFKISSDNEIILSFNSDLDFKTYFKIIKLWYRSYFYILKNYSQITPKTLRNFIEIWYFNLELFILLHNMIDILISKNSYFNIFHKKNDSFFEHIPKEIYTKYNSKFDCIYNRIKKDLYSNLAYFISNSIQNIKNSFSSNTSKYNIYTSNNNVNNIDYGTMRNLCNHLEALILLDINLENEFTLKPRC